MSRNLCHRECAICHGGSEDIILEESPRPITESEAGPYFPTYRDRLTVMNAHCQVCDAKYLAWFGISGSQRIGHTTRWPDDDRHFVDLSFRASFNDEPAPEDLPSPEFLREHHRKRKLVESLKLRREANELLELAAECERDSVEKPSYWEAYRR